jgi:hypothetical protein
MTDAFVRPAQLADVSALAGDMRPVDIEECRAFGREPFEALLTPFNTGQQVYSISDPRDCVYAMFGVTDCHTWGSPWMLTSNKFPLIARAFAQRSKMYFAALSKEHWYLENLVSANNVIAQRWLQHLGFSIERGLPVTHGGIIFYPFWKYNRV